MEKDRLSLVRDYQNFLTKFKKQIPKQYNQIELMDNLMNKDIDWFISISNRSDGKTFNYISFFMKLAIEFDIKFTLICRHYELRKAYVELLQKIAIELKHFKSDKLTMARSNEYTTAYYDNNPIALITDLNDATDLKYHSNYMKDFPIIVYDEFLALEYDYLPDEWEKLKTIYDSIDRNHGNIPYLEIPKIVLLGNAVNFSSPLLASLDIFNTLQKHPINTIRQYGKINLEMRRNDHSNEKRNPRAFDSENDSMTTGEFDFNTYNLTDDALREHIASNGDYFYVKTEERYIKIMYNFNDYQTNIKVVPYTENYFFCTDVKDVEKDVTYLKETYYREGHEKRYYRPSNLHFDNAYSKQFILQDNQLILLNINKLIKQHKAHERKKYGVRDFDRHEKMHEDNYIEQTKKYLINKYS